MIVDYSNYYEQNYYVVFLFAIKIVFAFLSIIYFFLKEQHKENTTFAQNILYWKDRCEFIFIAGVALLVIYLFNPRSYPKLIDANQRFILFVFGILIFIQSNWKLFFTQSKWLEDLQHLTGGYTQPNPKPNQQNPQNQQNQQNQQNPQNQPNPQNPQQPMQYHFN